MRYFEFGQEHQELMVMLHGGGVCYRGALLTAVHRQSLQKERP